MRLPNTTEKLLGEAIALLGTDHFETALYQWLSRCFQIDNTTFLAYFQNRKPEILFAQALRREVHERI